MDFLIGDSIVDEEAILAILMGRSFTLGQEKKEASDSWHYKGQEKLVVPKQGFGLNLV